MIEQRTTDPLDFCLDWKHWCKVKKNGNSTQLSKAVSVKLFLFHVLTSAAENSRYAL